MLKGRSFIRNFLLCLALSPLLLTAETVEFPGDTASSTADRVFVFDSKLPAERFTNLRVVNLQIKLLASVTNSVTLRLGRDGLYGSADGILSMEESFFELGIDRNAFLFARDGFKERYVHTPSDPGGTRDRTFALRIRVDPGNPAVVKSAVFEEDGIPFNFDGLQLAPCPAELNPVLWTDLRLLARNGGVQSVDVQFLKDGALIIIR